MSSLAAQNLSQLTTTDRIKIPFIIFLVVALGILLPTVSARATDAFPGNTISGMSGSFTDSNTTATGEAGEPTTFGGGNLNTIWYNWTAPATGTFTVQTCSSTITTFDTTLKAYSGTTFAGLTTLASNDDACANTTANAYASLISFAVTAGTNYKIQVDGYASITGTYLFRYNLPPPTVIIANTTNGTETGPASGVMTVTQSAISSTNTVIAYSVGGTATSGSDYTALSGTVTILAGATTATITIPVLDDAVVEGNETAAITLTGVTSGVAILGATVLATNTIADNDTSTVSIANITDGSEPATAGTLRLTLSKASATTTTVSYTVTGTAVSGTDYTSIGTSVVVPANALTFDITVSPSDDLIVEGSETVIVTLTAATSNTLITASGAATNTIADNDTATLSILNTTNGAEAVSSTNGVMTVTQSAVSSTNTVVTYTVGGTATPGSDYTALSGTVTILAGSTTAIITISVLDNLVVEPSETVSVTLTGPTTGRVTLSATILATNTISDNDVASFSISKAVDLTNVTTPSTLNYTITVASTGNVPLTAPVITDAISNGAALTLTSGPTLTSGDAAPLGVLNAGETWIYAATYAVSQANINTGASIANSATFDSAETAASTSNTVTTTITQNPHLTISKTVSTNGPVPVGTVVTYTYTVLNDGNMTMTNEVVSDIHNGSGTLVGPSNDALVTDVAPTGDTTDTAVNGIWDTIGPGDTIKFTATYAVTQHDVDYLQ